MSDINWDLAPEGAVELIQDSYEIYWGNAKGEWFDTDDMTWNKPLSKNHVTIATRPQSEQPLNWNNMKEGMKVVFNGFTNTMHTHWEFEEGNVYVVSRHECGPLGPLSGSGCVPSKNYGFDFSVIGEPERKTVEDAVEAFPDGYESIPYKPLSVDDKELVVCAKKDFTEDGKYIKGEFYRGQEGFNPDYFYLVCTREEFEACVAAKAKSEPEWTHKTKHGELCRIVLEEPDTEGYIIVLTERGEYIKHYAALKPIKPTITKAEKEKCAAMAGYFNISPAEFDEYLSKYEVVEA